MESEVLVGCDPELIINIVGNVSIKKNMAGKCVKVEQKYGQMKSFEQISHPVWLFSSFMLRILFACDEPITSAFICQTLLHLIPSICFVEKSNHFLLCTWV